MADRRHISLLTLIAIICGTLFATTPASATEIDLCPAAGRVRPSSEQVRSAVAQLQARVREREERAAEWARQHAAQLAAAAQAEILTEGDPQERPEVPTRLCNLDLRGLNLSDIDLHGFTIDSVAFQNANLDRANLEGATNSNSRLNFSRASLRSANLTRVRFSNANFVFANLSEANLTRAGIVDSDLSLTNISGAILSMAWFNRSIFQPFGVPNEEGLMGISGLEEVTFSPNFQAPLVQLREMLRRNGLREEERSATYGIERNLTRHMLASDDIPGPIIEGAFRRVAFEWTTGYGYYPSRALQLIFLLFVVMIPIYLAPIAGARVEGKLAGMYLVLPRDRLALRNGKPSVENPVLVRRLRRSGRKAWKWAAYFSLLSVFQIGFRDLSVGSWISRIQPTKFVLEPVGWVRTASGIQSLLSLYLLAMWLLTYFGRPFQ